MLAESHNLKLEPVTRFEVRPNLGGQLEGTYIPIVSLEPNREDTATMIGLILGTPEFQRR
jgi:hypothetical protein